MLDQALSFLSTYTTQLSAAGAFFVFAFGFFKYLDQRKTEQFWREFEVYHRLVKELVSPDDSPEHAMWVDRQTAAIFELRNFKRYYPHTLRMLKGLYRKWNNGSNQYPRLIEELEKTIGFIESTLPKRWT